MERVPKRTTLFLLNSISHFSLVVKLVRIPQRSFLLVRLDCQEADSDLDHRMTVCDGALDNSTMMIFGKLGSRESRRKEQESRLECEKSCRVNFAENVRRYSEKKHFRNALEQGEIDEEIEVPNDRSSIQTSR